MGNQEEITWYDVSFKISDTDQKICEENKLKPVNIYQLGMKIIKQNLNKHRDICSDKYHDIKWWEGSVLKYFRGEEIYYDCFSDDDFYYDNIVGELLIIESDDSKVVLTGYDTIMKYIYNHYDRDTWYPIEEKIKELNRNTTELMDQC